MALQKQKYSIPFISGIDTKKDEKQLSPGTLLTADNINFENPGKIKKRTGYIEVPGYDISNNKIDSIYSISPSGNELTAVTTSAFYSFSDSIKRWISKGKIIDVFVTSKEVVRNDTKQEQYDCLYVENTKIFVYKSGNNIRYTVIDNINDSIIAYDLLVKTGNGTTIGLYPKLSNIKNTVFIFYVNNGKVSYKSFNIVNPQTLSSEVDVVTSLDSTSKVYDVVSSLNRVTIAYHHSGNSLKYFQIYEDLTTSSVITKSLTNISSIDLNLDCLHRVLFSIVSGGDLYFLAIPANMGTDIVALTAIDTASSNIYHATANYYNNLFYIYYDLSNADTTKYLIMKNTISLSAVAGTPSVFVRGLALSSKAFCIDDKIYIPSMHSSSLQPSYFILDMDGSVISSISPSLAGEISLAACALSKSVEIDEFSVLFVSQIKGRINTDNGSFSTVLGINSSILNFSVQNPSQVSYIANTLHLANGIIHMYDGGQVVEHGFYLYPETITSTIVDTGGSLPDSQQYQYMAVYSWTDNKGQIHQSAPSIALSVNTGTGGAGNVHSVTVTVPTLRITNKTNVTIDLYRTEHNGTIFYRVTTISSPVLNDPTVDSITISDNTLDATLITREVIYTTGGVLENIIAPQASLIESFKNRIILSGLENQYRIQYSKLLDEGSPIQFNDTLYRDVNPYGGVVTAIKGMDDKLIIFKEQALFYMSGDGPNNLGQQDSFIEPELISSDVGCVNKNSVVLSPLGLFFKSYKGIYLLNRSLQLEYKGFNVEKYNNYTVTSAKTVETKNIIIFTTEEGTSLVYNYLLGQWSTYSNTPIIDAEIINNNYYILTTEGKVLKSDSSYSDNGTNIAMKVETGWLNFAEVQGLGRVYRMLLLGEFKSDHKLKISVSYDFKDTIAQEIVVDSSDFIDSTTYGEYSPYGSESLYGTDGNLMQIRINFQRQKCESMKIIIEDITEDSGEGLTLSNMVFLVGVKANTNTVNKNNRFAMTNS